MVKKASVRERILRVLIIIVAVLLVISVCLLVPLLMKENSGSSSSTGNIIQSSGNQIIRLADASSSENTRFEMDNIFPGDSETNIYSVELLDSGIKTVRFGVRNSDSENRLYEVLNISVKTSEILYDGLVKDMPGNIPVDVKDCSEPIKFEVTVSVDTSVGNELQGLEAALDFTWWMEDGDYVAAPTQTTDDDDFTWYWLIPLIAALLITAAVVTIVLINKRKKPPIPIVPPTPDTPVKPDIPVTPPPAPQKKESSRNKKYTATVTLDSLMKVCAPGEVVNIASLKAKGLVPRNANGYKVLRGALPLDRPLIVYANSFSAEAMLQIKAAGGKVHYL